MESRSVQISADTLRMTIYNGDDQALIVDSIKTYIRKYYLVAYLNKNEIYALMYGDEFANFPEYDLAFGHQLPDSLPRSQVSDIQ